MQYRVGFLGAGQMARALAQGLISTGVFAREEIAASDPVAAARDAFAEATNAFVTGDNRAVGLNSELVVLAVKPQAMPALLRDVGPLLTAEQLVVSIAAGVTLDQLAAAIPQARLVRVMPNTPCLVGAGASAFALGPRSTADDAKRISQLLGSAGVAIEVGESLLDAVTGLSGSGPAYVFTLIEGLADGGVLAGLPRSIAQQLAAQTVLGAARMVLESGQHPGVLKDAVASPGGTTIAGLRVLEQRGLRGAMMDAVSAATARSRELSLGKSGT